MAAQDEDTVALVVEKDFSSFWRQTVRVGQTEGTLLGSDPDTIWNNYEIRSDIRQIDLQSDIALAADRPGVRRTAPRRSRSCSRRTGSRRPSWPHSSRTASTRTA